LINNNVNFNYTNDNNKNLNNFKVVMWPLWMFVEAPYLRATVLRCFFCHFWIFNASITNHYNCN